ncbi:MAG: guanylate kinase [Bacteroidetes bacterium]|nr:guanylate kinase [Bacteroidota bacterium]
MKLIVFCGPSGSGKTSIKNFLLATNSQLAFSVSATTRPMREFEKHGVDYYFISIEEFKAKISNNEFIEWEEVYANGFYGTLKSEIERINKAGRVTVFDVDVEGGLHIKESFGDKCLAVFVRPPSITELHKRLVKRGTETDESLRKRVAKAELEMTYEKYFDRVIINNDFDLACEMSGQLVTKFLNE